MPIWIRETRPGVFRLRFERPNQRAHYKTIKGTRAEADAAAAVWAAELEQYGAPPFTRSITLAGVIRNQIATGSYAPRTREYYEFIVGRYIDPPRPEGRAERRAWGPAAYDFNVGRKQIGRITAQDGVDFQSHLQDRFDGSGNSGARSISEAMRLCMAALDYCVRLRLLPTNPWTDIRRVRPRPANIRVPRGKADMSAIQRIGGRVGLLLRLALATGARRGELLALTWRNVDLDAGTIDIQASLEETRAGEFVLRPPKSRAGRRQIEIPPAMVGELRTIRAAAAEAALAARGRLADVPVITGDAGGYWPPDTASQAARRALHAAGIPTSLHALRHASASVMLSNRVSPEAVRRRLGHGQVATTLRFYAHEMTHDDADAAAALGRAIAAGSKAG